MKKQKIIKVGNSYAVTLPASYVRDIGYTYGDEVMVETNTKYKMLTVVPIGTKLPGVSAGLEQWLDEIEHKYDKTIKKLAKI